MRSTFRTLRFGLTWSGRAPAPPRREVVLDGEGGSVSAHLYSPEAGGTGGGSVGLGAHPRVPAWIVLHGITRPGRDHPSLVRFSRALASTGALVLVPEIPEWKRLELAPRRTAAAVRAGVEALDDEESGGPRPVGLVGFSFGGPQGLCASARPGLTGRLDAVVSWGGYADLERTFRFQFTGVHEWEGRRHRLRPDPYGRWVVGANLLPSASGFGNAEDVAQALHTLAARAGDSRIPAGDPALNPVTKEVRGRLCPSRRDLFDLFAPVGRPDPTEEEVEGVVQALLAAAARENPELDPSPLLPSVRTRARLLHGRGDRLIPFTETLRLERSLPREALTRTAITGLFAHSGGAGAASVLGNLRESARFGRALQDILTLL